MTTALNSHYINTNEKLPCDNGNIEMFCTNYTDLITNDTASCLMDYETIDNNYGLLNVFHYLLII